jgi:hypothetical protein
MSNDQTVLTNLFAELAEAEKEFTQAGIHLGLDPDNWEEQNKYEALDMLIETLKVEIANMQGI